MHAFDNRAQPVWSGTFSCIVLVIRSRYVHALQGMRVQQLVTDHSSLINKQMLDSDCGQHSSW